MASLLFSASAFAQTAACDALNDTAKATAKSVLDKAYPYDCCDQTISACLKSGVKCKLPERLANEVCRLAGIGKSAQEIRHQLDQRAMTMSSLKPPANIELKPEHVWGNPEAKVVLSVYLCARCPYCSRHVPALIKALEKSELRDKVAVNLRLYPIKSHENSTPAALAVEAAAKLGKAWPYLLKSYEHFDEFAPEKMPVWASEVGMDEAHFNALMQDSAVRQGVVSSKKEGLSNSVESTPTFFLNGRLIQGAFDADSIVSMVEEALDNIK